MPAAGLLWDEETIAYFKCSLQTPTVSGWYPDAGTLYFPYCYSALRS